MSSIESEFEKSFSSSNVEKSSKKLSTSGKILIGLSGKWKMTQVFIKNCGNKNHE